MAPSELLRALRGEKRRLGKANFLVAGQSNTAEWFKVDEGAPREAFRNAFLQAQARFREVQLFDIARGGSAMLPSSAISNAAEFKDDPSLLDIVQKNYWYDETTDLFGPAFERACRRIKAWRSDGISFDGIIWSQGESDAIYLDPPSTIAYRSGMARVFGALMEASGAPAVYIQEFGLLGEAKVGHNRRAEIVRELQRAIAAQNSVFDILSTTFDLPRRDVVHLTGEGYRVAAMRMGIAIATGEKSPLISGGGIAANGDIILHVDLADGQQLDGCEGQAGFEIFHGDNAIAISAFRTEPDGRIIVKPKSQVDAATISYAGWRVVDDMGEKDRLTVTGPRLTLPVRPSTVEVTRR